MPDHPDDLQKRLDKLNDMQKYLPFLDSMIEQINKKNNPAALESQLGKFQHLKSILVEQNPKKHSFDVLIKLEDIIEKLIVKLDYKDKIGGSGESSNSSSNKNAENTPTKMSASDGVPPLINYHAKDSEPIASTSSNSSDRNISSKSDSTPSTVDMIMKQLKLSVSKTNDSAESSKPKSQPPLTELLGSIAKPVEKKNETFLEPDLDKDLDGFDLSSSENKAPKQPSKPDLLTSSRQKLLKTLQKKPLFEDDQICSFNKPKQDSTNEFKNKSDSDKDNDKDRDKDRDKDQNRNRDKNKDIDKNRDKDRDRFDFSDDSHYRSRKSAHSDFDKNCSSNSSSHRSSDWKKNPEPPSREKSPSQDSKNKQKLRDKLSADITEVYKVGKSVGGSLRSLKDTKKNSGAGEDELFKPDKVTYSKPSSVSPERQKKDQKTTELPMESRIEKRLSYLDYFKNKDARKSEENKEKAKPNADTVDDLTDEELVEFVKENNLPNLSGYEPSKLRKIVKQTLAQKSSDDSPEYDPLSDQDLDDFLNEPSNKNKKRESQKSTHPLASVIMSKVDKDGIVKNSRILQGKKNTNLVELEMVGDKTHEGNNSDMDISFEDDDDFAVKLIEDLPPPLVNKRGLLNLAPLPPIYDEDQSEVRNDIPFFESRPPVKPPGVPENLQDPRQARKPPLLPTPNYPPNQFPHPPTNEIRPDILRPEIRPTYTEGNRIPTIETVRRPSHSLNVPPFNSNFQGSGYNDPRFPSNNLRQIDPVQVPVPVPAPVPAPLPVPPPINYNFPVPEIRYPGFDPKFPNEYRNMNSNNVAVVRPNNYAEYRQRKRQEQELYNPHQTVESGRPEFEKSAEPIKDPKYFDRNPVSDSTVQGKSYNEENQTRPTYPSIPNRSYDDKRKPQDPRQRRYGDDLNNRDSYRSRQNYPEKKIDDDKSYRSRQPSYSDERKEEDKRRSSSDRRLSSDAEEIISPLEKLYQDGDKPKTGRGYGLQNFKIPKKVRDPPPQPPPAPKETPKPIDFDNESIVPPRLTGSRPKRGPLHFDDESDSDSSRRTDESCSDKINVSKDKSTAKEKPSTNSSKKNETNEGKSSKTEKPKKTENKTNTNLTKSTEKTKGRKSVDSFQSETKSKSRTVKAGEKKKDKTETRKKGGKKLEFKETEATDFLNRESELDDSEPEPEPVSKIDKKKSVPEKPVNQVEPQVAEKPEPEAKADNDAAPSNGNEPEKKGEKIDEIEDIIRKSFQSGEGELLLKKAKLFQQFSECTTNLTEKRLKKLKKVMGYIGDNSSSSTSSSSTLSQSDSDEEATEKKKKKKKKKSKEVLKKLSKKKKKKLKRRVISSDSSSSSEESEGKEMKEQKSDGEKEITQEKKIKVEKKLEPQDETKTSNTLDKVMENVKLKTEPAVEETSEQTEEAAPEPGTSGAPSAKGRDSRVRRGMKKRKMRQSEATKIAKRRLKAKEHRLMRQLTDETKPEEKPRTKHRRKATELDKLHDDIRSMFICEGVVTATGQRTCRLLKENGGSISNVDMFKECAKVMEEKYQNKVTPNKDDEKDRSRSQSVETETSRDRSVSRSRNHSPGEALENQELITERKLRSSKKLPVVVLQRTDVNKFGYAYKIADVPSSLKRPHGRNVAKRSGKINVPTPRNIVKQDRLGNRNVYLNRNIRKIFKQKDSNTKKRFIAKSLEEIVNNLKTNEVKQATTPRKNVTLKLKLKGTRKKKLVISKEHENEKKEKTERVKMDELKKNLIDHAFDRKLSATAEYPCLLCSNRSRSIGAHYKTSHSDSEVLISRLSKEEAEKAIGDSNENNYNVSGLDKASSLDAIKRRVKSKLSERGFFCRMCSSGVFNNSDLFFAHVSTHTGEFRYKCPAEKCTMVMPCHESMKAHIFKKHQSAKQSLVTKVIELFPLPTEYDHLYGYLCSKCYYVQTMRRNVEQHVAVFHSSDIDVEIIKIDMSAKPDTETPVLPTKEPEKRAVKKPRGRASNKNVENKDAVVNDTPEDSGGRRRVTRSRPAEEKQFLPTIETPPATDSTTDNKSEPKKKKKRKSEVDILLEMQKKDTETEESDDSSEEILGTLESNSPEIESDGESRNSEVAVFSEHVNEFVKVNMKNLQPGSENQKEKKTDQNREDDDGSIFQATQNSDSSGDTTKTNQGSHQVEKEGETVPRTYKILKGPAGSVELHHEVKVGPLEARLLVNMEISYECFVKGCVFSSYDCDIFEKHITIAHNKSKWDGMCQTCGIYVESPNAPGGVRSFKLTSALDHLKDCHEVIKESEPDKKKRKAQETEESVKKKVKVERVSPEKTVNEDVDNETDSNPTDDVNTGKKVKIERTEDAAPFPVKPLLRVRNLLGDRLSTPKMEMSPSSDAASQLIEDPLSAEPEPESESEPALFTIESVMSLNPAAENESALEETPETNQETPPPIKKKSVIASAKTSTLPTLRPIASAANKPVVIRSAPSPTITIRPANPINQAKIAPKQIPIKVVPVSPIGSPVVLAPFGSGNNIRLIASSSVTMQPMMIAQGQPLTVTAKIVPIVNPTTSATQPKISTETQTSSILRDNPLLTQTVLGNKPSFEALRCTAPINSSVATVIQMKSPTRITSPSNPQPSASTSDAGNEEASNFRRPHPNAQGGKNVKDAKIYQEMLTKSKLCQLFKCMAVECSFTCSNESVFTQHIGLHEAHQKMQNQKMNIKSKKVYNWQQCAYCCEVIVQSGAALSQHILSEHGHCLYQCAYCFYRAVSQTYVELHQNYVHPNVLTQRPRVILKCKPIPNLPPSKTSAQKQSRRQSVRPYLCVQCSSRFFITQEFMDHLAKEHQSVTAYTCHICKNLCFKADRLIAHYKLHSYGTFQCAYCLHAAETKKEMLFHLCNCHFSQPAYMYVRALAQGQSGVGSSPANKKKRGNHLDALEVVSYENDSPNSDHIIEADTDDSEGPDGAPQKSASLDLTAIVTELGIDVEDSDSNPTVTPVMRELMSLDSRKSTTLESLLPNAQFSSEDENSILTRDDSSSVPIGQLPLEALGVKETTTTTAKIISTPPPAKETTEVDKTLKLNEIIINLSKDKSITVIEKPADEVPVLKSGIHKMPPTVSPTKFSVKNVYSAKTALKKQDNGAEGKKSLPLLYQRLSSSEKSDSEDKNTSSPSDVGKNVISGGVIIHDKLTGKSTLLSSPAKIVNITSPTRKSTEEPTMGVITNVVSLSENEGIPQISEVRSLSQEDQTEPNNKIVINIQSKGLEVPQLQPPIIRVEDFQTDPNKSNENPEKDLEEPKRPESPEIIILDDEPEDENQSAVRSIQVIDSDEEKGSGKRTRSGRGLLKKLKIEKEAPSGDKIRQEMEELRHGISETDSWLLDDDDTSQISNDKINDNELEKMLSPIEEAIFSLNKKLESEKDDESCNQDKEADELITVDDDKECAEDSEKSADKDEDVSLDSLKDKNESKKSADKGTEERNVKNTDVELFGKNLYKCGVGKCTFAAETDTELRDHLFVCDHSRESSIITCPHCSKKLKQTVPYVDHLKLHGERKYKCGLCDFASGLELSVVRHLKLKHKVNQSKSVPREPLSKGYFTIYPKNHKTESATKDLAMTGYYSPGDEDKLPLQAVYLQNVFCSICPYHTKVRSNMVRHLKIHVKSAETEGVVIVPSTAPTNPVPCLDTKEKMFDKMTNLAASSQLAQAKDKTPIETLSPEEEAKLPKFVVEQMRYKCCSPDCTYLTVDDNMLKNHIKTLHDEITFYSCPHCQETVPLDFRLVALEKVGNHLKYHDSKLYKCAHCSYFHHQKHVVEKHVLERHPEKKYYVYTVREPKIESASEEEFTAPETGGKAWKCGLCNEFESTIRNAVHEHVLKAHNSKSKYKCKLCDMKSSQTQAFTSHFTSKHPGEKVGYVKTILKVNAVPETVPKVQEPTREHFDTTPLWKRDAPRVRHIRGILIEEEEVKTKRSKKQTNEDEDKDSNPSPPVATSDCYYCPLCTDKKKPFQTKSSETFRSHLYTELNYNQFACMLCGKMFVDRKEFEKHHVKLHPDKPESLSQTKEDQNITFWVEKVINKQRLGLEKRRRESTEDKTPTPTTTPTKKKKMPSPEKSPRSLLKRNLNRSASSSSDSEASKDAQKGTRNAPRASKEYEKEFICRHCQIKVNDLNSIKAHIKVSHLRLGRFLCTFCDATFQTETLAQKHCRNEHPTDPAKIIPNPERTELNEEFWKINYGFENGKIVKNFTPKNVVRCRFCNFRDIPQLVTSHEKQHLQAVQFKCGHCSHRAKDREEMTKHIETAHPGAMSVYTEVSYIPSTSSWKSKISDENEKLNMIYSCKLCPMESNFEHIVVNHLEKKHKTSETSEIRKNDNEQIFYCCNNCAFRASDVEALTIHGSEMHLQSAVGYQKIKLIEYDLMEVDDIEQCVTCQQTDCVCGSPFTVATAPDGYYNCPECDFICSRYEECLDHFKSHYTRFGCKVCVAKFVTEAEFQEHHKITKHPANFKILEPEKNALEDYKRVILMKKNGNWVTLGPGKKRSKDSQDQNSSETKKAKATRLGVGGGN